VARVRSQRSRLFAECEELLDDAVVQPRGLDFPVLHGRWHGDWLRLEPVVDTLSMRTLPVLWLVVTVRGTHPGAGPLSVLARECGSEFYSRHEWAGPRVRMGPAWPRELSVRCDVPPAPPQQQMLEAVRQIMSDGSVKQVALDGTSTRLVWKCATADSSAYRVTRRVDLEHARVDPCELERVLSSAEELSRLATVAPAGPRTAVPAQPRSSGPGSSVEMVP
jgi:hypothetical protein